jgi:DeoR family transcriptional regulator, suf operon transcriptional repressor
MLNSHDTADSDLLDAMRLRGSLGIAELAAATGVTATAVRQRLNRLIGQGLVQRRVERGGRGRPSHRYWLTGRGVREAGTNLDDLAVTLWNEIRSVEDPDIRRGLLRRIALGLAQNYRENVRGATLAERMEAVGELFRARSVPLEVDSSAELPVLTALACPYPDVAERDRSVCAMEKMLFADLLGSGVELKGCRLDGAPCCTFEVTPKP